MKVYDRANLALALFAALALLAASLLVAQRAGADPYFLPEDRYQVPLYIYDTSGLVPCDPEYRRGIIAENTAGLVADWQSGSVTNEEFEAAMYELTGGLTEARIFGC